MRNYRQKIYLSDTDYLAVSQYLAYKLVPVQELSEKVIFPLCALVPMPFLNGGGNVSMGNIEVLKDSRNTQDFWSIKLSEFQLGEVWNKFKFDNQTEVGIEGCTKYAEILKRWVKWSCIQSPSISWFPFLKLDHYYDLILPIKRELVRMRVLWYLDQLKRSNLIKTMKPIKVGFMRQIALALSDVGIDIDALGKMSCQFEYCAEDFVDPNIFYAPTECIEFMVDTLLPSFCYLYPYRSWGDVPDDDLIQLPIDFSPMKDNLYIKSLIDETLTNPSIFTNECDVSARPRSPNISFNRDFLNESEVVKFTGLSRYKIKRKLDMNDVQYDPRFPLFVKKGGVKYWSKSALEYFKVSPKLLTFAERIEKWPKNPFKKSDE